MLERSDLGFILDYGFRHISSWCAGFVLSALSSGTAKWYGNSWHPGSRQRGWVCGQVVPFKGPSQCPVFPGYTSLLKYPLQNDTPAEYSAVDT